MYRIGIDLGGTKMAAALVDDNYRIILKETPPTHPERPADRQGAFLLAGRRGCVRAAGALRPPGADKTPETSPSWGGNFAEIGIAFPTAPVVR